MMFKMLIFKLYTYFNGIVFFKTDTPLDTPEFRAARFVTIDNQHVVFNFYKVSYVNLIYKKNKIHKIPLSGYVIQILINEEISPVLSKYNDSRYFFNSVHIKHTEEKVICDTLLNVFLDFLKNELLTSDTM